MSSVPRFPALPPPLEGQDDDLVRLLTYLERLGGFHGLRYKDKCLRRRIATRLRARGLDRVADYLRLLENDAAELDRLLDALTINVTKFFRNPEVWEEVERTVVPALFAQPGHHRLWSAGCASGEEPYTLALLLYDYARRQRRPDELARFEIIATDIDRACLARAQRAEYPSFALTETPARWRVYLEPGPPHRVPAEVRRLVRWQRHDLLADPYPTDCSLILCRNVIIYFAREVQDDLFRRFHGALRPGGFLLLGKVETILGPTRALFEVVRPRERLFRRPLDG